MILLVQATPGLRINLDLLGIHQTLVHKVLPLKMTGFDQLVMVSLCSDGQNK